MIGRQPLAGADARRSVCVSATNQAPDEAVKPAAPLLRRQSRCLAAAKLRVTLGVRDANN
jgi:hypothetical protein